MSMESEPRTRIKAISAKALSSHGYAVCLFPEQPKRKIIIEQDRATEEEIQKAVVTKVEAPVTTSTDVLIRLYWRNRLVYLIAFISYCLSLNNVYHFPMNIYRYGHTFFLPYTLVTVVIGYPLHVLETSIGQYSQQGIFWAWECAPLFSGVGLAMIMACALMSLYHNIFAAYSLVYFAHCFTGNLPWSYCTSVSSNDDDKCAPFPIYVSRNTTSPSKDYFYNVILNTPYRYPSEVWELGSLKWWLFISVLFSWFVIYAATFRSVRSIEKVAIFIVIFSYFAILSLLVVAIQLRNTGKFISGKEGTSIFDLRMWCSAVIQVLLELGLCFGIPVVYGSYCRFRNLLHIDSIILCSVNYLNSIIFFYLFYTFFQISSCDSELLWDIPDNTVAVIYIVYSEAIGNITGSSFWCVLFFFMLFCILISTQIAVAETMMTVLYDNFINLSKYRWLINLIICVGFCIFGIFFCFTNGFHGAVILHYIPLLFVSIFLALFFVCGIIFVYGLENYSNDIKTMLQGNLNFITKLFLYLLVIVLTVSVLILIFSLRSPVVKGGIFYYESHAIVAWVMCAIIMCPIVICAVLWILYCVMERQKICRSSNSWIKSQEERKAEKGQYTSDYLYSFTWPWNKYQ